MNILSNYQIELTQLIHLTQTPVDSNSSDYTWADISAIIFIAFMLNVASFLIIRNIGYYLSRSVEKKDYKLDVIQIKTLKHENNNNYINVYIDFKDLEKKGWSAKEIKCYRQIIFEYSSPLLRKDNIHSRIHELSLEYHLNSQEKERIVDSFTALLEG